MEKGSKPAGPMPGSYSVGGIRYEVVRQTENVAMAVSYSPRLEIEVFIIQRRPAREINGSQVAASIAPPAISSWGVLGFSFFGGEESAVFQRAEAKFSELQAHKQVV